MSRTNHRFIRAYVSGYDLSGTARDIGSVGYAFDNEPNAAFSDGVKNIVNGQMTVQADPLNAFLSPETSPAIGLHELLKSGAGLQTYTIAYGILAAPAQGDFIFSMPMEQAAYQAEGVAVNVGWGGPTSTNTLISLGYSCPFGRLLHPFGVETAVNAAVGIDDYGASPPELGGILTYHLYSSIGGNITIKVQEADTNTNGSFTDITGATSGLIDASSSPKHGVVAISATYAVKRYLRWQVVFNVGTSATFLAGFNRRLWS